MPEVNSEACQRSKQFSQKNVARRGKTDIYWQASLMIKLRFIVWGVPREMTRKNHIFSKAR
jgi:hypothetical protein